MLKILICLINFALQRRHFSLWLKYFEVRITSYVALGNLINIVEPVFSLVKWA